MPRLDAFLAERGIFKSRSGAKAAIVSGYVSVDGEAVRKPSAAVQGGAAIAVSAEARQGPAAYVGRGGAKLAAALDVFGIDVAGVEAIDIGASTGGFTDCLLKRGVARVHCVDVGSGQLHASLRDDPRVSRIENVNARYMRPGEINGGACAFAVIDVSFISLRHVLGPVFAQLSPSTEPAPALALPASGEHASCFRAQGVVCLVKPQFELGPGRAGKRGVVRDPELWREAVESVAAHARSIGAAELGRMRSPVPGGDGNTEFFLWLLR